MQSSWMFLSEAKRDRHIVYSFIGNTPVFSIGDTEWIIEQGMMLYEEALRVSHSRFGAIFGQPGSVHGCILELDRTGIRDDDFLSLVDAIRIDESVFAESPQ